MTFVEKKNIVEVVDMKMTLIKNLTLLTFVYTEGTISYDEFS